MEEAELDRPGSDAGSGARKGAAGSLKGLKVLDLTRVIAGPLSSQYLGDLGADVIKIERRGEGDDVRRVGPPWMKAAHGGDSEESTYFQSVNRNKRSIAIDFAKPGGAALIRRLAETSDVLIENYRPGTLARYGLGYERIRSINRRLIYCAISGFGQTGPYASRSGYDYLVQGMAGLMSVTGLPDGEQGAGPLRVGIPLADIFAAMNAVIGILAALQHRNNSGEGQYIDISLFDSQFAGMLNPVSAWLNSGAILGRTGNDHPSAAPYGVYEVADGHLIVATFSDREFYRLAKSLGHPEWITDPRFAKNSGRVANRSRLRQLIQEILIGRSRAEWVAALNEARISCGPINSLPDVLKDPQILAREMVVSLPHRSYGDVRVAGNPVKLSMSPVSYRAAAPMMGEHTEEVLKIDLGLSERQIEELRHLEII